MNRIVILGVSGAGKSTLAKKIHSKLGMKVYHLDRVFWEREWKGIDKDSRVDILGSFVREKQWIIDGNYLSLSELHLDASDTIIFLDIFPFLCFWRLIKRHFEYRKRPRRDIPEGCTDRLTFFRLLKVPTFRFNGRRIIQQKLRTYDSKQIVWLRSTNKVKKFEAQLEQEANERRGSFSLAEERSLVIPGR